MKSTIRLSLETIINERLLMRRTSNCISTSNTTYLKIPRLKIGWIHNNLVEKEPAIIEEGLQATTQDKYKLLPLIDLITHIINDDTNKKEFKVAKAMTVTSKVNLVQKEKKRYDNKKKTGLCAYMPRVANPALKRKECYFGCGKSSYYAS